MDTHGPLQGIRVVELTDGLAGAYAGRQFALWGAEVLTLEPPGGSPLREFSPRHGDASLLWEYVAGAKRAADMASLCPTREAFEALLQRADVLIIERSAAALRDWTLSADDLHATAPGLTIVEMSPFGADGPLSHYAASELVVQALSGYLSLNGEMGRAPLKAPGHILSFACGVSGFAAGLAGLIQRERTGSAGVVEVSELDCITCLLPLLRGQYSGTHQVRSGGPGTGARLLACRDGYISIVPPTPEELGAFEAVLGIPADAWPAAAHDRNAPGRPAELSEFIAPYFSALAKEDVLLGLLQRGMRCGIATEPAELPAQAHLRARAFFRALAHPTHGHLELPGPPAILSRTPATGFAPSSPRCEQLDLADLDWSPRSQPGERASPAPPLEGVRILDLTQAWIGPFAGMLLADLGADVLKIESHRRPDVWRQWGVDPVPLEKITSQEVNASPNYNSANVDKRSLCLDLKSEKGREILIHLAQGSDLLIENYTPRVMERLGLSYPVLSQRAPSLVMTSFSGYGKTGPLSDFKANGVTTEAMAGWDYLHRYPDGSPMVMGFYQADAITGLQMTAASLVGLFHRLRSGAGQSIDGAMLEAAVGYIGETVLERQVGPQQTPFGNRDANAAPNGVFPCLGNDEWIAISILDDAQWRALLTLAPELDEPGLSDLSGRLDRIDELEGRLATWTERQSAAELEQRLQAAGLPSARVRSMAEVLDCPHLAARGWFRRLRHPDVGEHRYNGVPWRFKSGEGRDHRPPPRLGEHGRQVLREWAGLSEAEVASLEASGVTGSVFTETPADAETV